MEKYYRITSSDELYHHGIKGQKWGIRRFQNEDGSLTAEGRERLGYGDRAGRREINREAKRNLRAANKESNSKFNKEYGRIGKYFSNEGYNKWLADRMQNYDAYYKTRELTAKNDRQRASMNAAQYNAKSFADYYTKKSKRDYSQRMVANLLVDTDLMNMSIQRASGRHTTFGKTYLDQMLTGGLGGIVLDSIYKSTGKDYSSAVSNKINNKVKKAKRKIDRSLGV